MNRNLINSIIVASLCLTFFSGCLGDVSGVEPPSNELIYPVGLAVINDSNSLMVVNSNFDLEYNAGTAIVLDLSTFDTMLDPQKSSYNPMTGVLTYQESTAVDNICDSGTASNLCILNESKLAIKKETIRVGAYASDLEITPAGDRALIAVRGERTILSVDISNDPSNIIDCGEGSDLRCDSAHRIKGGNGINFPIEPHRIQTMDYIHEESGKQITETLGFATHRAGGEVSLFSVSRKSGDGPVVSENELIEVIDGVVKGASGLAVNPTNGDIYVSGQNEADGHIAVLRVLTDLESNGSFTVNPWFSQVATVDVAEAMYRGTDARDIALSPDGQSAFVITQNPPALLKIDLSDYTVDDMVTVCQQASSVKTLLLDGDTDDPSDDKLYAFVSCFITGQLFIVDTNQMTTVVRKTGEGPQDIAIDSQRQLMYIANFSESTISVFQSVPPFSQIRVRSLDEPETLRTVQIGTAQ